MVNRNFWFKAFGIFFYQNRFMNECLERKKIKSRSFLVRYRRTYVLNKFMLFRLVDKARTTPFLWLDDVWVTGFIGNLVF